MLNNATSTWCWMDLSDLIPHRVLLIRWEVGGQHRHLIVNSAMVRLRRTVWPKCLHISKLELFHQIAEGFNVSFQPENPKRKEMGGLAPLNMVDTTWANGPRKQLSSAMRPRSRVAAPMQKDYSSGSWRWGCSWCQLGHQNTTFGYETCAKSIHSGLYRSLTLNRNAPWLNCRHLQTKCDHLPFIITRSSQGTAGLGRLLPTSTSEKSLRHPHRPWEVDFASSGAAQQDVSKTTQPLSGSQVLTPICLAMKTWLYWILGAQGGSHLTNCT